MALGVASLAGFALCLRARNSIHDADEVLLEWMIEQMNKTTAQASAAIDDVLVFVEDSNKRIAAMELEVAKRKDA